MGKSTEIEWTDATWNPIRGCSRQIVNGLPVWTGKVELVEKHLLDPLKWGLAVQACADCGTRTFCDSEKHCPSARLRPRRIFVNSMSDLFHPNVSDAWIDRIFAVMAMCPQHTFQVLTKRPDRMQAYCTDDSSIRRVIGAAELIAFRLGATVEGRVWNNPDGLSGICIPNVHLGVSVENQAAADERIESLLRTPAAVRFLSIEPMLGKVNLNRVGCECDEPDSWDGVIDCLGGFTWTEEWDNADGTERHVQRQQTVPHLDWVIVGGESGPGARPMHPDWARSLRDQCVAAGVPFFFKQWGEFTSEQCPGVEVRLDSLRPGQCVTSGIKGHHTLYTRVGKKLAGALLDGREWKEFPRG